MNYSQLEEQKKEELKHAKQKELAMFLCLGVGLLCMIALCVAVTVYGLKLQ